MEHDKIDELMPQLIELARDAGSRILEVKREALAGVESKADGSPVTLADRAAHERILAGLARLTPNIPVLSEEGDLEAMVARIRTTPSDAFWLVDPLDGTKEFVKENGEYTVNIALVENGVPTLGIVHPPEHDKVYYAAAGQGAFVTRGPVDAVPVRANAEARKPKIVASRSHYSEETAAFVDQLSKNLGEVELQPRGSSVKLCAVAEGAADVYPRLGPTMIWDTAAGYAVAVEAGCGVVGVDGKPLTYLPQGDLRQRFFVVYTKAWKEVAEVVEGIVGA